MTRGLIEIATAIDGLVIDAHGEAARLAAFPAAAKRAIARADLLASLAIDVRANVGGATRAKPVRRGLGALDFWQAHRQAVEAIGAVYGDGWAFRAPIGRTVLATLPAAYRSHRTERGTVLHWRAEHRIPAGEYWPGGELPAGLTTTPDYPRHVPGSQKVISGVFRRKPPDLTMSPEEDAGAGRL